MQRRTFLNASLGLALPSVLAAVSPTKAAAHTTAARRPQRRQHLKNLTPAMLVTAIRRRRASYHVATADGTVKEFREFDLRFKTDSTADGPDPGRPAIVPAAAAADRASVIFASPEEIGTFIRVEGE